MTDLHIPTAPAWMADAACVSSDYPDLWFTDQNREDAKRICKRDCGVRLTCLRYALDVETPGTTWGIWGGLDENQRRRLMRAAA